MSAGPKVNVTMVGDRAMRAEHTFDAPRARVWRAYTEAKLVAQWWGRGQKCTVERLELHKGGHWRFVVYEGERAQGFEGRFREVTPPERLVMTFEWDGMPGHVVLEKATFEELPNGKTRVVTESLFLEAADRDGMANSGMEEGMRDSYAALEKLLASM